MLNKYEIEIPDQVIRALGLMDKEVKDRGQVIYFRDRSMDIDHSWKNVCGGSTDIDRS